MSTEICVPVTNRDWSEAQPGDGVGDVLGLGAAFGQQGLVQAPQVGVSFARRLDGLTHLAAAHRGGDRPRVQAVAADCQSRATLAGR